MFNKKLSKGTTWKKADCFSHTFLTMQHFKPVIVKHTYQPSTVSPANSTDTIAEIIQYANTFGKMASVCSINLWPLY